MGFLDDPGDAREIGVWTEMLDGDDPAAALDFGGVQVPGDGARQDVEGHRPLATHEVERLVLGRRRGRSQRRRHRPDPSGGAGDARRGIGGHRAPGQLDPLDRGSQPREERTASRPGIAPGGSRDRPGGRAGRTRRAGRTPSVRPRSPTTSVRRGDPPRGPQPECTGRIRCSDTPVRAAGRRARRARGCRPRAAPQLQSASGLTLTSRGRPGSASPFPQARPSLGLVAAQAGDPRVELPDSNRFDRGRHACLP